MTLTCKHDDTGTCVIYPSDNTASFCVTRCPSRTMDLALVKQKKPMTVPKFTRSALKPKGKTTGSYIRQQKKAAKLQKVGEIDGVQYFENGTKYDLYASYVLTRR